jgi:hypothetical protein
VEGAVVLKAEKYFAPNFVLTGCCATAIDCEGAASST